MSCLRVNFWVRVTICACVGAVAGGCAAFGLLAHAAPDPTVDAQYKGLAKQTVAVMVWNDRGLQSDWPYLQLDLTRSIQGQLQTLARQKKPPKELEGTTFAAAESSVRYTRDHPEVETEAIADVAPRLNVSRLIYIEVQQFATRPEESLDLFRGSITADLKVLEIGDGKAKVVYEDPNLHLIYPDKSPEEGIPGLNDSAIYEKTVEAFTTKVVNQFIPHTEPRE